MELRQVKYFVVLAGILNFSKTAKLLYITQPTLSQQINELEKELGIKLLDRTKRHVTLTEDGERFLIGAKDLLGRSEALVRGMADGSSVKKELRIAISAYALEYSEIFHSVVNAGIRIKENGITSDLIFDVAHDVSRDSLNTIPNIDCVVYCSYRSPTPASERDAVLMTDEIVLVTASSLKEPAFSEVTQKDTPIYYVSDRENMNMLPFQALHSFIKNADIRITDNITEAVLEVSMGKGRLLFPKRLVRRFFHGTEVTIHSIPMDSIQSNFSVICSWREESASTVRPFLDYCRCDALS